MTSIRAEIRGRTPVHDMLTVWAGPDAEHRAHCGDLYMRTEEAAELIARVNAGELAICPVASEPVDEITPEIAAHVLFHFGRGGWPASGFKSRLVELIATADVVNRGSLALGFPGYVAAFNLAQTSDSGTATLRTIVAGAE